MNIIAATLNAKYIHTCLALRCLKSYAEPDFDIDIVEYTVNDPVLNIVTDLFNRKPDVVGFSCYIWNIEQTLQVIELLKKVLPDVNIVLGGPEVSYDTKIWFERSKAVDFIVIGEGEETFKHLLEQLAGEQQYSSVLGLAYRKETNITINPPRPKLDLKHAPSPHRFTSDLSDLSRRVIYFETSRGCPFNCQFCLSSIETGVRYYNIEQVKSDLLYLIENGAKLIKFVDRTFNIRRSYALEIFQFLIDNHQGCVFQFEITADIMRPEVIEFLNEKAPPGIFRFEIGVQSTNDRTNELVMRIQDFEKLKRTVTMVKQGGKIVQHLDLIAGLPEEDYSSFRRTFNDVFAMRPEELQLGFLKLLRGTGLRLRADQYGYVYMERAPYEILSNDVLSFADVVKIKQVEDILEKYWNAHRCDETIEYLIEEEFETAFDFFQQFGAFWNEHGWSKIGHQLEDLFLRLELFLKTKNTASLPIIKGLMIYDYLRIHKHKPHKTWWEFSLTKKEQANIFAILSERRQLLGESFARLELTQKDLHKHTMIEVLPFQLEQYVRAKEIVEEETLLVAYFDLKKRCAELFSTPLHHFK